MKPFITLSALLCILLLACQQEITDIINQAQQCKIITSNYLGGGGMNDSATYSYNASGQLIKVENQDGYYTYFYNGNNIVKRTYHENVSNDLWWIDSVYYSAGSQIAEHVRYDYSGLWSDTTRTRTIFYYQNGRLSALDILEYYNSWSGPVVDSLKAVFYWSAVNNMEKMVYFTNGQPTDSILYQFDNKPNYFKIIHPNFFVFEPQFQLYVGLEPHFPYFYSNNNVINSNMYGGFNYPIDYGLDSVNNVTSINMGGFEYIKYRYDCP